MMPLDALNRQLYDELIGYIEKDPRLLTRRCGSFLVARYLERMADPHHQYWRARPIYGNRRAEGAP